MPMTRTVANTPPYLVETFPVVDKITAPDGGSPARTHHPSLLCPIDAEPLAQAIGAGSSGRVVSTSIVAGDRSCSALDRALDSGSVTDSRSRSSSGAPAPAGVLDLYRAGWTAATQIGSRRWVSAALALGPLAAYIVLRSFDADRNLLIAWVVFAGFVTVLSPASGLIILVGIAPFTEPITFSRQLGVKPLLIVILGAAVAVRYIAAGGRPRPSRPIVLAAGVALGTAAGVGVILIRFGPDAGTDAAQSWLAGIGGAMVVLIAATWLARTGDRRPLMAAVLAGAVAAIVSLADFSSGTLIRDGPLDWTVRSTWYPARLMGVIPSPNGTAALLIGPAAVLVAAVVLARDARLRLLSAAGAIPLLVGLYFTFSRAALIGIFLIVVVCAWRIRRWAGVGILVAGLGAAILLTPAYLQARGQSIGIDYARPEAGQIFIPSDRWRLQAWGAAARMWADEPLIGQGFLAYGRLAPQFGDDVLAAPHNEWLRLFAEEGFIVGLVGVAFVLATFVSLVRDRSWLGAGILAAFLAWCVAATFNNPLGYVQVNTIIFTIVGTGIAGAGRSAPQPVSGSAIDPVPLPELSPA
jgi:hypothetical protein